MIIIGLGNPGKKYERTRHNAGFLALDELANREELHFNERTLFHSLVAPHGEGMVLAKPQTFMNESGKAVKMLLKQYDGDLVVVYDDIDISLGEVKCSFGRGSGDHNGVQSIIDHLGHKEFFRIRIGVRPVHDELLPRIAPPDGYEKFLLSNFTSLEDELLKQGIGKAVEIIDALKTKTFDEVMNQYN